MNNYIKCKYPIEIDDKILDKIDADLSETTFICKPIDGKLGEFRVGSKGELFHNVVEYEEVNDEDIDKPGVIWNGTGYAIVKNTDWSKIDFTGTLQIETHIISKKTDASIKIDFEFMRGNVVNHTPEILLIDNTSRLEHDTKIKNAAIQRAKRMNSTWYQLYSKLLIKPLVYICIILRYPLIYIQEFLIKLENKLNTKL